jgi:hypothetical protein
MVRRITVAAGLALFAAVNAQAQLDLTPTESFYEVEGIRVPNVSFRNGVKKIAYSPPADWTLNGGERKVTMTPRDSIQAGATIETVAMREPSLPATTENLKAYTDLAVSMVPREGTKVEVAEAAVCPMRISGKEMIEVTLTYSFFGQPFRMNVLFMPRDKEQLRFQFIARAVDYPPLFKAFRSSLFSMQGL